MDAVHEDVDSAEALGGGTHEALGVSGDCEVGGYGESVCAFRLGFFNCVAKRFLAARGDGEAAALVCENEGSRAAYATGGAGNDGDFAAEA